MGDCLWQSCQRKERKERVERQRKKGEETVGMGLRVNLGRAAAIHFPGCDSGELGVKPTFLSQF
jgi:hypothetical protein